MKAVSWLFLLVSFVLGIVSAFVVAHFTFDAKPIVVVDRGPTVKILIAQKEIPIGAEIRAEDVTFEDVPITEIPSKAMTNFMQAYRRRPAYPIPVGCPICEDLLLALKEEQSSATKYLPAGSQVVSLEVEQLRFGENVSEMEIPISDIVSVGDRIDIRAIPRQSAKGEYIERKNQVLRAFASKSGSNSETDGELVLENIGIHDIASKGAEAGGKQIQTLSLLLENGQADKLTAAARDGRLRIALRRPTPHQEKQATNQEQSKTVSDNSVRLTDEASPSFIVKDNTPVRSSRPTGTSGIRTAVSIEDQETKSMEFSKVRGSANVSFVSPRNRGGSIHNESPETTTIQATPARAFTENAKTAASRPESRIIEVGLSYTEQNDSGVNRNYSPFSMENRQSVLSEEETDDADHLSQPLPLRNRTRFQ